MREENVCFVAIRFRANYGWPGAVRVGEKEKSSIDAAGERVNISLGSLPAAFSVFLAGKHFSRCQRFSRIHVCVFPLFFSPFFTILRRIISSLLEVSCVSMNARDFHESAMTATGTREKITVNDGSEIRNIDWRVSALNSDSGSKKGSSVYVYWKHFRCSFINASFFFSLPIHGVSRG